MKVYISPHYGARPDRADGGIRRVVEAQTRWLPLFGVQLVDSPAEAELLACHGTSLEMQPGVPIVSHSHGLYWDGIEWEAWAHEANRQVVELMIRAVAHTAPSEWVANALRRGGLFYPEVIYHGVDTDKWKPTGKPSKYVLWNKARSDPVSDPNDMQRLAMRMPTVPFATTLGEPAKNVKVIGVLPVEEMLPVVAGAAVYLATARETFGIGTLEALASGVPVAGWDWGGQSEIVLQGETGYLATPGDYDALVECVQLCLKERSRLSANAQQDATKRWAWPQRIEQYAKLYQRVHAGWTAKRPRVSVIVTCHNLARYLPDALGSVLAQTMPDWECLIVDDASTDDTRQIANQWEDKDARFRYEPTLRNLKLPGALNSGIARSSGRYVLPLDADNLLDPNALLILSNALDTDPAIHIAYGHLDIVDEQLNNRRRNDWPWAQFNWRAQMAHLNMIPSSCLVRREVYERSGGYRTRQWRAEDAELWCRATSQGFRARKVTEASMFTYRERGDSKSKGEHGDGDWTAWLPWRLAGSAEQARGLRGSIMLDDGPLTRADLVPWSIQGKPPKGTRFWSVPDHTHPTISVIIPVGSLPMHETYLIDALDSLIAQDCSDWECIVVNDTSRKWESGFSSPVAGAPWARVIDTTGEQGTSVARNLGARYAKGECLLWLDADDYLLPSALTKMLALYRETPGIVYGDWLRSDSDLAKPLTQYESWDFVCGDVLKQMRHSVTSLVPREAHARVGGFDETITTGWEDWDYFIALQDAGVCSTRLVEPVFVYRFTTGKRRENAFDASKSILKYIRHKWSTYYERGKTMPCAGCPQSRTRLPAAPKVGSGKVAPAMNGEAVLLYYDGPQAGPLTIRGVATGTAYRFGHDSAHRQKYVHVRDVPGFLSRSTGGRPHFVKVERKPLVLVPATAEQAAQQTVDSGPHRPEFPTMDWEPVPAPAASELITSAALSFPSKLALASVDVIIPNATKQKSDTPILSMTVKELRDALPEADEPTMVRWLKEERASMNRVGVIKLITTALNMMGAKVSEPA